MLLIAAAALVAASPPNIIILPKTMQPPHSTAKCLRIDSYVAGAESRYDGKPLSPRNLTRLPSANMYVAVFRNDENGCLAPIIVRYDVGR